MYPEKDRPPPFRTGIPWWGLTPVFLVAFWLSSTGHAQCLDPGLADAEIALFLADLYALEDEAEAMEGTPTLGEAIAHVSLVRDDIEGQLMLHPEEQRDALCELFEQVPELRELPSQLSELLAESAPSRAVSHPWISMVHASRLPTARGYSTTLQRPTAL